MFSRTEQIIGSENLEKLKNSRVAVFGVGGVGGFTVEALVRSGIGSITVVDNDKVELSNFNRQIIADSQTLGMDKIDAIEQRMTNINCELDFCGVKMFYLPETADIIDLNEFDYVVDAIDTVTAKIELIKRAKSNNIPIISCMGTGRKTDPTLLKVEKVGKTKVCPLARVMRRELAKIGITDLKVVYSEEVEENSLMQDEKRVSGRQIPASMIFVPASAGILIAREVVFDLINKK